MNHYPNRGWRKVGSYSLVLTYIRPISLNRVWLKLGVGAWVGSGKVT